MPAHDGVSLFKELSTIIGETGESILIYEYDFIFMENDISPFMVFENKLGIELKTAKYVSLWLNKEFFKSKRTSTDLYDKIYLEKLTRCLLLFICDCSTAWNIRKEFIIEGILEKPAELDFISLILSKNPKSSEVFFHRKWCLQQSIDELGNCNIPVAINGINISCKICNMLEKELEVCQKCTTRRSNNQVAWNHRFWVLNNFSCYPLQMTKQELERSKSFLSVNLSDNSAFNYRKNLLINLLRLDAKNYKILVTLVAEEFKFVWDLINFYSGFESLWFHRRYITHLVMEICQRKACMSEIKKSFTSLAVQVGPSPVKNKPGHLRHNHLSHSHYHHSNHRHYNHHHHRHHRSIQRNNITSDPEINSTGFEFLDEYPDQTETGENLLGIVEKEMQFFKDLKVKFQRSYVPKMECSWSDIIAKNFVVWYKFKLKEFVEN